MTIILEQLGLLFMFIALGYFFGKKGLIKSEHSKVLSTLGTYLFSPCVVLQAFATHFNIANIRQYYPLILAGAAILTVLMIASHFGAKLLAPAGYDRKVYEYSLITPNYGFMGYALAEGVFGPAALLSMILFAIPHYIYIYTMGFCALTNRRATIKQLLNPIMLCLLAGAFIGITGIRLPDVVNSFLAKGSACMAPMGMVLTGLVISEFDLRKLVTDKKVYITSILRLLVIPLAAYAVLRPLCSDDVVRSAMLLLAMPCGLNTIIFPKLVGEDCSLGAKLAFVSSIMSIVTLPLILGLL